MSEIELIETSKERLFEIISDKNFKIMELYQKLNKKEEEIERLNNIIDEATKYLKDNACYNDMGNFNDDLDYDKCGDLLEILDKENKKC